MKKTRSILIITSWILATSFSISAIQFKQGLNSEAAIQITVASQEPFTTTPRGINRTLTRPLRFERYYSHLNDDLPTFVARVADHRFILSHNDAILLLRDQNKADSSTTLSQVRSSYSYKELRLQFPGSKLGFRGTSQLTSPTNLFFGSNKEPLRVASFAQVRSEGIYPGITVVFYGEQNSLEYDFLVDPGIDTDVIAFGLSGANSLEIAATGDLLVNVSGKILRQLKPFIYQTIKGVRKQIEGGYTLKNNNQVGFWVGKYDKSKPLVIDPVLVFSTYLGGSSADEAAGTAVDPEGNIYVVGTTDSLNFPSSAGVVQSTLNSGKDVFVTKLKPNGRDVVYSTYIGGSLDDYGASIAVDNDGSVYITGTTLSSNFPTTPGALQTTSGGGTDAFVVKLSPSGSALSYSTLLGGSGNDEGLGIAINSNGNAFITGTTASSNFPSTVGALQAARNGVMDAFVTKLNPNGSAANYSTFIGGSGAEVGFGIALDKDGNQAFVTGITDSANYPTTSGALRTNPAGGNDGFVTRLNDNGTAATYSTLIGGSATDAALGIAVDSSNNAFVTGLTESANFPVVAGAVQTSQGGGSDAFALKLNSSGSALTYSTYLGGSSNDVGAGIGLDYNGNAYVTGTTNSTNFPHPNGTPANQIAGAEDAFVLSLNNTGTALTYSTDLGGTQSEEALGIAVSLAKDAIVTGTTRSINFPTTTSAFQTANAGSVDSFATRVANVTTPLAIDDPEYFVQQHYLDFLNRIPDAAGLAFWKNEITSCGTDTSCREVKRINVSAAYFLSTEFQGTGFLVYRMYNAALNRRAGMPFRNEFLQDTREVGRGVIVNSPGWEAILEANKVAFSTSFVQRPEFVGLYPISQSPTQFVDALYSHAVITPDSTERNGAIAEFGSATNTSDSAARGRVLRRLAENPVLTNREFNRAFVLMQYFGYLRRNPDDAPDGDLSGFNFWSTKLNQFGGNFVNAEMVKAFITSDEYRRRFGQ